MAENRQDKSVQLKNTAGSRPSSATREERLPRKSTGGFAGYSHETNTMSDLIGGGYQNVDEDREAKIKSFKERQNEERQKKLDEMKSQALAAQRFKEQKEHERRQRLDELRLKEDERRQQVEDRKRAINEAERDRLESILKRNQEREARIESKRRNERSSLVFAFGSSTPRMLGPSGENGSSFWGHRRATSTQNITYSAAPLTRRQSERELDGGSKKRATSAGGLERSGEAHSRPSSSLSQQSTSSVTSSVTMRSRPIAAPRRPRPVSIAVTGITSEIKNGTADPRKPENKPPLPKTRKSSLVKSQEKIIKKKSLSSPTEGSPKSIASPTAPPAHTIESPTIALQPQQVIDTETKNDVDTRVKQPDSGEKEIIIDVNSQVTKEAEISENNRQVAQLIDLEQHPIPVEEPKQVDPKPLEADLLNLEKADIEKEMLSKPEPEAALPKPEFVQPVIEPQPEALMSESQVGEIDMSASMSSKPRITTEEEAKAALAERRRIAREEAERQAELERLRIENEIRLEFEHQQREEEQQRQLIELQRAAEEERLKEAIREAQRREEEEKQRREEEQRLKLLKEEAERKAREEAERQKAELQERLKNEEKEREARRKRVEAIMLRTRGKNNTGSAPQMEEKNAENKLDSKVNGSKTDMAENGHKNGKDIETVDNIIPVDTIKNANTVTATTLSTDDTLNSNDSWQRNSQTDLLM